MTNIGIQNLYVYIDVQTISHLFADIAIITCHFYGIKRKTKKKISAWYYYLKKK